MLSNKRLMPLERNVMPDSQFAHQRSNVMLNEPVMTSSSPKVHVRRNLDDWFLGRAIDRASDSCALGRARPNRDHFGANFCMRNSSLAFMAIRMMIPE